MINCVPGLGSDVTWDCHFSSFSSVTSVLVYRLKREHTCFYVFHVQESFFFFCICFIITTSAVKMWGNIMDVLRYTEREKE